MSTCRQHSDICQPLCRSPPDSLFSLEIFLFFNKSKKYLCVAVLSSFLELGEDEIKNNNDQSFFEKS